MATNREAHRELFLKAQEVYREDMIAELDAMLADAKSGKKIRRHISMPEPQDHTSDYDRVIAMLDMSTDDIVEIEAEDFDKYVMDNWSWAAASRATNMMYAAKKLSSL